jgi:hypothetical protein
MPHCLAEASKHRAELLICPQHFIGDLICNPRSAIAWLHIADKRVQTPGAALPTQDSGHAPGDGGQRLSGKTWREASYASSPRSRIAPRIDDDC